MRDERMAVNFRMLLDSCAEHSCGNGFQRTKNSIWRVIDDVYHLIDFQVGSHGENYFFVNIAIHPIGLPMLVGPGLEIRDRPREFECAIRCRIEDVSQSSIAKWCRFALMSDIDQGLIDSLVSCLDSDVESWFRSCGTLQYLAHVPQSEILPFMTAVPAVELKAHALLACYCRCRVGDTRNAQKHYQRYLSAPSGGYEFPAVDEFLGRLIKG